MNADRGALDPESLKKLLGLRGGQIRRMTAVPAQGEMDAVILHLAKVSQRDIRAATASLKEAPGVHEVSIEKQKRNGQLSQDTDLS